MRTITVTSFVDYGGLEFGVRRGVYRPMAEMLPTAELAAEYEPKSVIDLGCGCGAQGIVVAKRTGAYVIGVDRMPEAVEQSWLNAEMHEVEGVWRLGNLYEPIDLMGKADLIINTLPYEPTEMYEECEDDVPRSTYVADGSFGEALYWGPYFSDAMVVYGIPGMEPAFEMAGWKVEVSRDVDDARHFLLRHA